ncbi:DAK2 domain-containing protein [Nocardia acidivorans]|uniref:DAK2 domain-containing protein n=1 Tax=Nocardia acidivorans TaxID=404580 RepID=UPI000A827CD9|nr:DAK2 domain-containing protein [Nocardia acidivorans]
MRGERTVTVPRVGDELDGEALLRWAHACLQALTRHRDEINALNVFPVADSDTGTNLLSTMRAAVRGAENAAARPAPPSPPARSEPGRGRRDGIPTSVDGVGATTEARHDGHSPAEGAAVAAPAVSPVRSGSGKPLRGRGEEILTSVDGVGATTEARHDGHSSHMGAVAEESATSVTAEAGRLPASAAMNPEAPTAAVSAHAIAGAMARASTLGARGNSGIILSQVLRGIADAVREEDLNAGSLRVALHRAARLVREALSSPVEGTMLTVLDRAADHAAECSDQTLRAVALAAADGAAKALGETPSQLGVLARAGVVDAGARGLLVLLDELVAAAGGQAPHRPEYVRRHGCEVTATAGGAGNTIGPGAELRGAVGTALDDRGGAAENSSAADEIGGGAAGSGSSAAENRGGAAGRGGGVAENDGGTAGSGGRAAGNGGGVAENDGAAAGSGGGVAGSGGGVAENDGAAAGSRGGVAGSGGGVAGSGGGVAGSGGGVAENDGGAVGNPGAEVGRAARRGGDAGGRLIDSVAGHVNTRALAEEDVSGHMAVGGVPHYEVMFLLTGADEAGVDALREKLGGLGDSVAVVGDGEGTWSAHVHCADAGAAVEAGLAAGALSGIRIETLAVSAHAPQEPVERGILAVAAGAGAVRLFEDAGAQVLEGEVTAEALLSGIRRLPHREVLVLPNGALPAHELVAVSVAARDGNRDVLMLPSASMVQGLAALSMHDGGRIAVDDAFAMSEAAAGTRWGALRIAPERALTIVGTCEAGDGLGLVGHDVVVIDPDVRAAGRTLLDRMLGLGGELVTMLVGAEAPRGLSQELAEHVGASFPGVEVVVYPGGQAGDLVQIGVE